MHTVQLLLKTSKYERHEIDRRFHALAHLHNVCVKQHHRQKSERICGMAVFSLTSTPASPIRNHTIRNNGGKNG